MSKFRGFPDKMQFTPVPNIFYSAILPHIEDITELKVTLHIFKELYHQRGYPRFVTSSELLGNVNLRQCLKDSRESPESTLGNALAMTVERGTFLRLTVYRDGVAEDLYFLNSDAQKQVIDRIQTGEIELRGLKPAGQPPQDMADQSDIFTLYEQNIGMLTPLIAEDLAEAEKLYPESWVQDAIKEAVSLNKRNWRYISRILERWSAEGRSSGAHRRDSTKDTDPEKYAKQKYGHMVRH